MGDFSNLREGMVPPTFDHVAIVDGDRVEQPGTLYRDPSWYMQQIQHEATKTTVPIKDKAADKFGVVTLIAGTDHAYQLLPVEQERKDAVIIAIGNPIWFGDDTSVSNALGYNVTVGNGFAPAVFPLFASNPTTGVMFALRYTAKQGLYVASAGGGVTTAAVFCFVEKYSSGTPVR